MRRLIYSLGILTALIFTDETKAQFFGPYGSYYSTSYSQFGTSFGLASYNFRSVNYLSFNNGFPINNFYGNPRLAYSYSPAPVIIQPVAVQPVYLVPPPLVWYNPPVSIFGPAMSYQPYLYPGWWLR